MWIFFSIASVVFTGLHAFAAFSGKSMAKAMAFAAFGFTALTLLSEYAMVVSWVQAEDWSALLDVVPFMFPMLIAYTVILVAANGLLLFAGKKAINFWRHLHKNAKKAETFIMQRISTF